MEPNVRIEAALEAAVSRAGARPSPPGLAEAMRYAVFPGGARVRPRLCTSVACACGDDLPALTDAAAAAIELLHCASLVHDDLPCFDDAATRRGKPSVHRAFGEPLAVLAGDALIVLAFDALAAQVGTAPERGAALLATVARATGSPHGVAAGQAWECEPDAPLLQYHRAKTGALFVAATMAGALAAGVSVPPWRRLGERLGEAYQVADDLRDVLSAESEMGKPAGQDRAHGRPSAVTELGEVSAKRHLEGLVGEALEAVPSCPGAERLRAGILAEMHRVLPGKLALVAA